MTKLEGLRKCDGGESAQSASQSEESERNVARAMPDGVPGRAAGTGMRVERARGLCIYIYENVWYVYVCIYILYGICIVLYCCMVFRMGYDMYC